jgi:dienelactone hydrolase
VAISGALFKPEGAGPFPAVIVMPGCGGLVLKGEKDNATTCLALKDTPNFEVVVYPGAGHGFDAPSGAYGDYDEKATQDAAHRADAFMAAHMK